MLEIGPTCPFALQAQPSTSIWAQVAPSEEKERGAPKNSDAEEVPGVPPQAAACSRGFALCPCAPYSKPFVLCKQLLACAGNDCRTRNQVVKICPEVMGGLSIPHPPHEQRVLDGQVRVVDAEGNDHTEAFEAGARAACSLVCESGCTHAILKAKSPSCGVGEVYDGTFSDVLVPGDGVATKMLKEAGVVVATEKNFRERFGCE